MSSHTPRVSSDSWERHKAAILDLYQRQGLPVHSKVGKRSVVQVMKDDFGFVATPYQYESQLRKWGSLKNLKFPEWKLILPILDKLCADKVEARLKISGKPASKKAISRGRRYVQSTCSLHERSFVSSAWLRMPEYSHISIETLQDNGEWSEYLPPAEANPGQPFSAQHGQTYLPMQDITADHAHHPATIDGGDDPSDDLELQIEPTFDGSLELTGPVRLETPSLCIAEDFFGHHLSMDPWAQMSMDGIPSPFRAPPILNNQQLNSSACTELAALGISAFNAYTESEIERVPTPSSPLLALPKSQGFVMQLLQQAEICIAQSPAWPKHTRLPSIGAVLNSLQSLMPHSVSHHSVQGGLDVVQSSAKFDEAFEDILMYSIANGFAGLRGIPHDSIIHLLKMRDDLSPIVSRFLKKCPECLRLSFMNNILCASIQACDPPTIKQVVKLLSAGSLGFDLSEALCEYQGDAYTPVSLAVKFRHIATLRTLLELGSKVDNVLNRRSVLDTFKTSSEVDHEFGLAAGLLLLEWGASFAAWDIEAVSSLQISGACSVNQAKFVEAISRRVLELDHSDLLEYLGDILEITDSAVALDLIQQLLKICPSLACAQCAVKPVDILSSTLALAALRRYKDLCDFLLAHTTANSAALAAAIRGGDSDIANSFVYSRPGIHSGVAKIRYKGEFIRTTPLAEAIRSGKEVFLSLVQKLGAWDFLDRASEFNIALLAAIDTENEQILQQLLAKIPEDQDTALRDAVELATEKNSIRSVEVLLNAGASPNSPHSLPTYSALTEAIRHQNRHIVELILESNVSGDDDIAMDRGGDGAMELAGQWGDLSIVRDLISMGFNINRGARCIALATAVKLNHMKLAELLLKAGANPNGVRGVGNSPMHEAVNNGDGKTMQYLISWGADPADRGAFLEAIMRQRSCLGILLDAFKIKYPQGRKGFGADLVIKAIERDDEELVQTLLSAKMDFDSYSFARRSTPLGFAIQFRGETNTTFVHILLAAGASVHNIASAPRGRGHHYWSTEEESYPQETAILAAIETQNLELVRLLLDKGAKVNEAPRLAVKHTPLQKACHIGSLDIVQLLLAKGATVNDKPARRGGGTALQMAAGSGSITIVKLLLSRGADIFAAPSPAFGRTPLQAAAEKGRVQMLKVLWDEAGARGFTDEEIEKASSLAKKKGHIGCVRYIAELKQASGPANSLVSAFSYFSPQTSSF